MEPTHVDPKQIVADGYDRIAEQYGAWASQVRQEERAKYTAVLLEKLPVGAAVLDLGCGAGLPTTHQLAERFAVTGVDLSARQVALAQHNVPTATFLHTDMTQLDFDPMSFDGVAAFYSLLHVPRHEHLGLLRKITAWLRAGGGSSPRCGPMGAKPRLRTIGWARPCAGVALIVRPQHSWLPRRACVSCVPKRRP